jgi:amidophosphoribosyltransferase
LKLNVVGEIVKGHRLIIVDDSIVRGTTTRFKMAQLRRAGAKEIHLRISAPPTTHSCFYGLDTPTRSELIASAHSIEEIGEYVECTSIAYLSHTGLMESLDTNEQEDCGFCSACFTGEYPVAIEGDNADKLVSIKKA